MPLFVFSISFDEKGSVEKGIDTGVSICVCQNAPNSVFVRYEPLKMTHFFYVSVKYKLYIYQNTEEKILSFLVLISILLTSVKVELLPKTVFVGC